MSRAADLKIPIDILEDDPDPRAARTEISFFVTSRIEADMPMGLLGYEGRDQSGLTVHLLTQDASLARWMTAMHHVLIAGEASVKRVSGTDSRIYLVTAARPANWNEFLERGTISQLLMERSRLVSLIENAAPANTDLELHPIIDLQGRLDQLEDELFISRGLDDVDLDVISDPVSLADMAQERSRSTVVELLPMTDERFRSVAASELELDDERIDVGVLADRMLQEDPDFQALSRQSNRLQRSLGWNPADVFARGWGGSFPRDPRQIEELRQDLVLA